MIQRKSLLGVPQTVSPLLKTRLTGCSSRIAISPLSFRGLIYCPRERSARFLKPLLHKQRICC